jgi:O-antigen/teichoic acid export membrane protein
MKQVHRGEPTDRLRIEGSGTHRLRRVVGNTLISLVGQLITWSSTLVLTIAYGRFLGDVKFGELYFATTLALFIGIPMEYGFNQQMTRDVAQEPARATRYLWNTLLIKVSLWSLLYGLLLLFAWLMGYSSELQILVAISGLLLLSTGVGTAFAALHYAFERTFIPVIGTILEKGLGALVGFWLLKSGGTVVMMAWVLFACSSINTCWQALYFFRLQGWHLTVDLATLRTLLRSSLPFLIYGALGVIYYRLDVVLLSLMTNDAVVGWYGAGYRLFDTLTFLPSLVIATIMYPVFSKLALSSRAEMRLAIEKSMNFLLFCGIPLAAFMIVAAPGIIGFLYHRPEFAHTVPVLQWLAPGLVFLYINMVLSMALLSLSEENKRTVLAGIALLFNLGVNLMLIPFYGQVGAAVTTSLTELLFIGPFIVFLPRDLLPVGSLRVGLKVLLASLVMMIALWPLRSFSLLITLPLAPLIYLLVTALLRTIPREDLLALYRAVRSRKAGEGSQIAGIEAAETIELEPLAVEAEKTAELEPLAVEAEKTAELEPLAVEAEKTAELEPLAVEADPEETVELKALAAKKQERAAREMTVESRRPLPQVRSILPEARR